MHITEANFVPMLFCFFLTVYIFCKFIAAKLNPKGCDGYKLLEMTDEQKEARMRKLRVAIRVEQLRITHASYDPYSHYPKWARNIWPFNTL